MKPQYFFFLMLMLAANTLAGQISTYQYQDQAIPDTLTVDSSLVNLVVVPFDPKMYRSEIDKEIGEFNGLNFQEVRGFMRLGLDNAIYQSAKKQYGVVRMHADKSDVNSDLMHIYASIGYEGRDYIAPSPPPKNKVDAVKQKMIQKLEKEPEPQQEAGLFNGELRTPEASKEKFMAVQIVNEELLPKISGKYQGAVFLFINQIDLLRDKEVDFRAYEQGTYNRLIQVHYSIISYEGYEFESGMLVHPFPGRENDIRIIIAEHFTQVADALIKKVPVLRFGVAYNQH